MGVSVSHFASHLLRVIALFVLFVCPALAEAQDWTVTRATKQVGYTVDKKTWHTVKAGSIIPNQAWISTGPRGRVTLARGEERISLSPNTLGAVITTQGLFSRKTEVVQQIGQISLDIEKRSKPHTYVHTPFLAAVVKGTSFTVTVTEEDASLSVQEGLVQVSSFTSGQSTHVGPGQQVTVDQNQTMSVAGVDAAPAVDSVAPSAASVAAVGQVSPIGRDAPNGSQSDQSSGAAGANSSSSSSSSSGDSGSSSGNVGRSPDKDNSGRGSDKGNVGKGTGDKGPGGKGPGDKGPGGKGPGGKSHDEKGPGEKGPDGKGPGEKGPDGKGPGEKGPDGKGPGEKGPDGKGPGEKGPGGKGPRDKDSD